MSILSGRVMVPARTRMALTTTEPEFHQVSCLDCGIWRWEKADDPQECPYCPATKIRWQNRNAIFKVIIKRDWEQPCRTPEFRKRVRMAKYLMRFLAWMLGYEIEFDDAIAN